MARMVTLSNAIAVRADSGFNNVAALVAHLRANPQKASYANRTPRCGATLLGEIGRAHV